MALGDLLDNMQLSNILKWESRIYPRVRLQALETADTLRAAVREARRLDSMFVEVNSSPGLSPSLRADLKVLLQDFI